MIVADAPLSQALVAHPTHYEPHTRADDLAIFQYTSGTTRELPEAVKHSHRAIVTLMVAALYGIGLRPGDRYFCPSSPAWGTACGTARWRHWHWASRSAPTPAASMPSGCCARSPNTVSPTSRPRPRTTE